MAQIGTLLVFSVALIVLKGTVQNIPGGLPFRQWERWLGALPWAKGGRHGRDRDGRGAGERQRDEVKTTVGNCHRNFTMGRETALSQAQPRENKGETNPEVVSGRDRIDKGEDQNRATGEETVGNNSEDEISRRVEEEEGYWLLGKVRLLTGGLAALL